MPTLLFFNKLGARSTGYAHLKLWPSISLHQCRIIAEWGYNDKIINR